MIYKILIINLAFVIFSSISIGFIVFIHMNINTIYNVFSLIIIFIFSILLYNILIILFCIKVIKVLWNYVDLNYLKILKNKELLNMPHFGQMTLQQPATFFMYKLVELHNIVTVALFFVGVMVFILLYILILNYTNLYNNINRPVTRIRNDLKLEFYWTLFPIIFLLILAKPSLTLLLLLDYEENQESFLVQITGNQWYWVYKPYEINFRNPILQNELADLQEFESRMVLDEDLIQGEPRLLTTDKRLILPTQINIKLLISSADVLHSWTVPAFGIKVDACPGRLNRVYLNILYPGNYYGQCSEICGVNHAFMPINVKAQHYSVFLTYKERPVHIIEETLAEILFFALPVLLSLVVFVLGFIYI